MHQVEKLRQRLEIHDRWISNIPSPEERQEVIGVITAIRMKMIYMEIAIEDGTSTLSHEAKINEWMTALEVAKARRPLPKHEDIEEFEYED